jgi:uncharacterized iron-regulated membrane protein
MPPIRKIFIQLHLTVGLAVALLLLVISASGLLMIFRTQIEQVVSPELFHVAPQGAPLTLDQLAARVAVAHPGSELDFIRLYGRRDAPVLIRCKDRETFYLDPYSGEIVGQTNRYRGFFGRLEQTHRYFLLAQGIGERIAGAVALCLLALFVSGVILWLPSTWRLARESLRLRNLRRLAGGARWLGLHKFVGISVAVFAALSAVTGLPRALGLVKDSLYASSYSSAAISHPKADVLPVSPLLSMQTLWEKAAYLVPDARETLLHFPENGVVDCYFIERNAPHANARTFVWLDARDGHALGHVPYARAPFSYRLYYWMLSWHLGQIGGLGGQLALLLASAGLITLVLTGTISYFQNRRASPRLS